MPEIDPAVWWALLILAGLLIYAFGLLIGCVLEVGHRADARLPNPREGEKR